MYKPKRQAFRYKTPKLNFTLLLRLSARNFSYLTHRYKTPPLRCVLRNGHITVFYPEAPAARSEQTQGLFKVE